MCPTRGHPEEEDLTSVLAFNGVTSSVLARAWDSDKPLVGVNFTFGMVEHFWRRGNSREKDAVACKAAQTKGDSERVVLV